MNYLMVLTAAGRRLSPTRFAAESAFVAHLKQLRDALGPRIHEMVVAMADMGDEDYREWSSSMTEVDEPLERIRFVPLHTWHASTRVFLREAPRVVRTLVDVIRHADLVHAGLSYDLKRPVEFTAIAIARALGKPAIAVTDMDNRRDTEMNLKMGRWSKRAYLANRLVYDPIRDLEQRLLVRIASQVLFKELQQVEDFGRGADHVRLFLDPNYTAEQVMSDERLERKIADLHDERAPLRVMFFGRLVPYKGVAQMLEAVALARSRGARLTFDIMGHGDEESALHRQVNERGLDDVVSFLAPVPYGTGFFETLAQRHVLLACPTSADTPRSTWDALAAGMLVLAWDTPFYRSIAKLTGAVDTTPWPEIEPLAERLVQLAADKRALASRARGAVEHARENTQTAWLERRAAWTWEILDEATRRRGNA